MQKERIISLKDEILEEIQLILDLPDFHVDRSRMHIRYALERFGEIRKTAWRYKRPSSILWVYLKDGSSFSISLGFRLRG